MPVIAPAELWQATGRYDIPELWKIEDRNGRPFVLALTHEETVTFHARELQSYKQLPQILYHFQTKVRDEPRPRAGLLRVREFVMKDAYSFDRDDEGLDVSFRKHFDAYNRMFERCGLETYAVQAESGMMGGDESIDYLAPAGSGENVLVTCERGDYAADLEIARGIPRAPEFPESLAAPAEVETPGVGTIEGLAEFLGIDAGGDVEGDARRPRRRGRPGARARRRPARGGEARVRARRRHPTRDGRRDPLGLRRRPGLARPRRLERRGRRRRGATRGPVRGRGEPDRLASPRRRARPRLRGPLRGHPPVAGRRHVPGVRRPARLSDGDRGWPHLQVGHQVLGGARRDLSRRERQAAAHRHGLVRRRSRSRDGGRGRAAPRRARDHLAEGDRTVRRARRDAAGAGRAGRSRRRRRSRPTGARCSTTTARSARARSSRTPTCSAARLRITVGKKTLEDGAVDVRDRATGEERRVPMAELGALP